jgi:unsaturated chondroitin disaccharide hydrolase
MCDRIGSLIPYATVNGEYKERAPANIYWWTNGFWPGLLWLMYNDTKQDKYLKTARAVEERLDLAFSGFEGLHHDVGFMWTLASVLDWRLTGDKTARTRALHAATILAGRYNPRGKFIRSWNVQRMLPEYDNCAGWIIVDCMMNLSILFWAGEQLNDPRFGFIARDHADTALKSLVREDGSCSHIAILDPQNGALIEAPAGQGYAPGSSWTRGQAWALYGFAITYKHTKDERYLEAAKRIAGYFCAEAARYAYIPPVDFRAPDEPKIIDTSAGTIAACGLLELGQTEEALNLLKAIESAHCNWDSPADGIVQMGTAQYHDKLEERHVSLIYGDYFFTEAIHRLCGLSLEIW